MRSTADRLRVAREKAGYKSAAEALERFGWKQSTYLAHENGQNGIRPEKAKVYAEAFNVTVGWLLTGDGEGPHTAVKATFPSVTDYSTTPLPGTIIDIGGREFASIPVYDVRFSAGPGAMNGNEEPIDFYTIGLNMLRDFTDAPVTSLVFVRVVGDSMEPLLYNGDWVLVDMRATRLATPGIFAFVHDGSSVIKHASQHMETGAVTLISHNSKYEPQTIARPERLHVVGRVVLSIRRQ
ncbi:MAG: XRE family transcriptional regulator [Rhizomicrobium sp.]